MCNYHDVVSMKFIALLNVFAHLVDIASSISVIISFSFSLLFYFCCTFLAVAVFEVVILLCNVIIIVINVFVVTFNVVIKLLFECFIIVIFFYFFFVILQWSNVMQWVYNMLFWIVVIAEACSLLLLLMINV
jgi:hypothetical protein